ncbi:MAG TPA: protein-L-isoaspartate O-methyltransferase [Novosphingobium sp.]|nr:protein-L-isoaspartate O-methyltransferase [Novosphingobium sp.]
MTVLDERPVSATSEPTTAALARRAMIDSQLRPSGVNQDFVLAAMARVAREDFVPAAARDAAYIDRAIPLGDGHFLAAPLVQGRMLAEATPTLADTALLVSGGSDYFAELLRPLVGSLEAIEADALAGRRKKGSFSLLVIDGAIEQLPDGLAAQLAEGGRIVTGLVERGVTRLAIGRKLAGVITLLPLAELGIPVLREFAAPKRWSF